jgi:sulfonate dioxygenase
MAPQNQTQTQTQAVSSALPTSELVSAKALAAAPVPVKNALATEVKYSPISHPELVPVHPSTTYSPIPELPYHDRALNADPTFKNLLADATITHLEPKIGSEISGIQLHELSDAQKDELALLVAERGVVFFRDQDITIDQQLDLGRYYGPLHIHQNYGHPEGYPEVHVVHNTVEGSSAFLKEYLLLDPNNEWHSDVTYERQVIRRMLRLTEIVHAF